MAYKQKGWQSHSESPYKSLRGLWGKVKKGAKAVMDHTPIGMGVRALKGEDVHPSETMKRVSGGLVAGGLGDAVRKIKGVKEGAGTALLKKSDTEGGMTKKEQRKHRRKVLKYNRKHAKPLNANQKSRIIEELSKMDPKDPEAKLLKKMLNLKKNK